MEVPEQDASWMDKVSDLSLNGNYCSQEIDGVSGTFVGAVAAQISLQATKRLQEH